ncbi:hypothetical protein JoomaDRAFT_1784 [Galbibacter orientalis DSM 19592]|uniref:Uncharacterized protein n=1 Tax=Galbibacter orientalis DSM 19592 TaxID=926559 RepID=I3C598_9FLAO|nr:hypothetical protein [Galbibacter orientalis]EIJ38791.1 hypothetical protein JoomaDRAFT_1784 [Galbibacter orientalis DSM 19592]
MKNLLFIAVFLLTGYFGFSQQVYVKGYYKSNGTYVQPHYRTAPNHTVNDNWSTVGNVNPYTGKAGTKPREGSYSNTRRNTISNPYPHTGQGRIYQPALSLPSMPSLSDESKSTYKNTSTYRTNNIVDPVKFAKAYMEKVRLTRQILGGKDNRVSTYNYDTRL